MTAFAIIVITILSCLLSGALAVLWVLTGDEPDPEDHCYTQHPQRRERGPMARKVSH